jgi:hypothetical protein
MSDVTALFWDVGGVILSTGGARGARAAAAKKFVCNAIDLGFGAHGLLLALLFRCGLAEGEAGEPMRFGAVLAGGECDDRVERRSVHAQR